VTHSTVRRILSLACRLPAVRAAAPRTPVVLLYHGVPQRPRNPVCGAVFEAHVMSLKQHFELVSPEAITRRRASLEAPRVLLTFDDGFRNNAEVVAPILRKHAVPALFFVSSRHATTGRYLWFSYLIALEESFRGAGFSFRGTFFDMSIGRRRRSVRQLRSILLELRPHPAAMYAAIDRELPRLDEFVSEDERNDRYAGMTSGQVAALAADPLFSIGVHTVDHPFLTKCEPTELARQIAENRSWIEMATGRRCDTIAYPSGDYDSAVLDYCRRVGLVSGYAVATRLNSRSPLEVSRIGIYSDSLDVLQFKVHWAHRLRTVGLPIG